MKIELLKQSVVFTKADAIVNAANSSLLGGGGVDGAIHSAAGPKLLEECKGLNGCSTGDAKITLAYDITNAKYIIHTVGPIYSNGQDNAGLLRSCYIKSLDICKEKGLNSIAFPCVSTGVYGYPLKDACREVIKALHSWEEENEYEITVYLCCFTDREYEAYSKLLCPVCGKYFFSESYEICPVCKWENDLLQREDENLSGGANKLSLADYRKEYEAQNE